MISPFSQQEIDHCDPYEEFQDHPGRRFLNHFLRPVESTSSKVSILVFLFQFSLVFCREQRTISPFVNECHLFYLTLAVFALGFMPGSVGYLDLDPQVPHVFGPSGSGPISQRYGSGSESFLFLINVLSGLKQCLQNKINIKFLQISKFVSLKIMCLWVIYKKKNMENFFSILKVTDKGVGSGVGSGSRARSGSLVRGIDPGIRIRTKMLRILNTDVNHLTRQFIPFDH